MSGVVKEVIRIRPRQEMISKRAGPSIGETDRAVCADRKAILAIERYSQLASDSQSSLSLGLNAGQNRREVLQVQIDGIRRVSSRGEVGAGRGEEVSDSEPSCLVAVGRAENEVAEGGHSVERERRDQPRSP